MPKKRKQYEEHFFMFMPPSAAPVSEARIQEWVEETRSELIDKKEPFSTSELAE